MAKLSFLDRMRKQQILGKLNRDLNFMSWKGPIKLKWVVLILDEKILTKRKILISIFIEDKQILMP